MVVYWLEVVSLLKASRLAVQDLSINDLARPVIPTHLIIPCHLLPSLPFPSLLSHTNTPSPFPNHLLPFQTPLYHNPFLTPTHFIPRSPRYLHSFLLFNPLLFFVYPLPPTSSFLFTPLLSSLSSFFFPSIPPCVFDPLPPLLPPFNIPFFNSLFFLEKNPPFCPPLLKNTMKNSVFKKHFPFIM